MNRRHYFTAQAMKQPQATPPALQIPVSFCRWLCSRARAVRLLCAWLGLGGRGWGLRSSLALSGSSQQTGETPVKTPHHR